mgnify:CR=1 FL=1
MIKSTSGGSTVSIDTLAEAIVDLCGSTRSERLVDEQEPPTAGVICVAADKRLSDPPYFRSTAGPKTGVHSTLLNAPKPQGNKSLPWRRLGFHQNERSRSGAVGIHFSCAKSAMTFELDVSHPV